MKEKTNSILRVGITEHCILKETRNATKSNANFCVSDNYYFEYHTYFQDRELKSENVTFSGEFNGEYEKHIQT